MKSQYNRFSVEKLESYLKELNENRITSRNREFVIFTTNKDGKIIEINNHNIKDVIIDLPKYKQELFNKHLK